MMSPMTAEARTDAELVVAARSHEAGAYGELFQRWYDRSFDVALNILRDRESAADVAQDAFLTGWEHLADLRVPAAFGGWILRTTRNRALNRFSRERARSHEPIDEEQGPSSTTPDLGTDPLVAVEREDRRRLVWTAVAVLGERDTSLLDLHLRHGMEPSEIAEELHITANNASQLLFRLRRKLRDAIGAVLLWRDGHPTCDALAELLADSRTFDITVASVIRQHRRGCPVCNRELSRQTDPERLFAAVPFVAAPLALKDHAIAALTQAGAPMVAPSAAVSTATSASASVAAPAHGLPVKLLAIGSGVIAFGLLITSALWPSGQDGRDTVQGTVQVTQQPTPSHPAAPTTSPEPGPTAPPESAEPEPTEALTGARTLAPDRQDEGTGPTTAATVRPTEPSVSTDEPTIPSEPASGLVAPSASPSGPRIPSELMAWDLPDWNWCGHRSRSPGRSSWHWCHQHQEALWWFWSGPGCRSPRH
jgi:RNA polymerase sigma factor (sigma-70 family)